jgi:alpha-galactosidase
VAAEPTEHPVVWGHSALRVVVGTGVAGGPRIRVLVGDAGDAGAPPDAAGLAGSLPPVEILAAGDGHHRAGTRSVETSIGARLVLTSTEAWEPPGQQALRVSLRDPLTGLLVELELTSPDGVPVLRSRTRVVNEGTAAVTLLSVTSLVLCGLPGPDLLDLVSGRSDWLGECRFTRAPLRAGALPELSLSRHEQDGKGAAAASSRGSWSTGGDLPVAGVVARTAAGTAGGAAWLWQVEHNGPWRWEVGEQRDGVYLAATGPTDADAQWRQTLEPGESFDSVPVAVAVVPEGGLEAAAAALTAYRRATRRPHDDNTRTSLVFNDYMNTLMGDPTTERLLPLVDAAAEVGAEVFCVDAGWYDDGGDWWDSVGEWQPSRSRFPGGIDEVLDRIRHHGMAPGLWLEPEVVGVRSPVAEKLPEEAFFQQAGVRYREHDRFHLDLRHPDAVAHLDSVVDRLVEDHGIGYFKLDYNIDAGSGTELDGQSAGAGLLAHSRAYLAWLDRVLDRHPGLVLENCASGAMRMDYALLSRLQLQSTSDQQDHLRYPPIAAAAPLAVLPEQAASWAYPQPEMSDEAIAFTMCTGLAGRLYLSGRVDAMSPAQRALVAEGTRLHKRMRPTLRAGAPFWPLELPAWGDPWIALGLRAPGGDAYVVVWSRHAASGDREIELRLPDDLAGRAAEIVYPRDGTGWQVASRSGGRLRVTCHTGEPSARVLHLPATSPAATSPAPPAAAG